MSSVGSSALTSSRRFPVDGHLLVQRLSSEPLDQSGSHSVLWASFVGVGTRLVSDLFQLLPSTGLCCVWSVGISVLARVWVGWVGWVPSWVPSLVRSSRTSLQCPRTRAEFIKPSPHPPSPGTVSPSTASC